MAKEKNPSSLLYEYLRRYQDDPTSRVFAPLAEAYRKAGLLRDAVEIAREGLQVHPDFVGGKVALARALFDLGEFEEVIQVLDSVVHNIPDNLIAQRLVAESSLMLGRIQEALLSYKILLYYHPEDEDTMKIVRELEEMSYEKGRIVLRTDPAESEFEIKSATSAIQEEILKEDQEKERKKWIHKIEFLQTLLTRVERYRALNS